MGNFGGIEELSGIAEILPGLTSAVKKIFLRHHSGELEEEQLFQQLSKTRHSRFEECSRKLQVVGDERAALADDGAPVKDGAEQCKDQDEGVGELGDFAALCATGRPCATPI